MILTTVNGHKAAYRISSAAGRGKQTLLCVHGSGGDSSVWLSQFSGLATDCTLIAPDLPGHGATRGRGGYRIEDYAAWIEAFAETLGLEGFMLMGYSMGGAISLAMAHAYPTRISGLILVSTALRFVVAPEYLKVLQSDFHRAARASCDNAYAPGAAPELTRRGLEMLVSNGGGALYEDVLACTQFDGSARAAKIPVPALVISGNHDTITPPEAGRQLASKLPQGSFRSFERAGHMVMQEEAEGFNAAVRHFLTFTGERL